MEDLRLVKSLLNIRLQRDIKKTMVEEVYKIKLGGPRKLE